MSKARISPQTSLSQRTSLRNLLGFAGGIALMALLAIVYQQQARDPLADRTYAMEYFFSPVEDHFYENPANWRPSYPGLTIPSNSRVVLQDLASFSAPELVVQGSLETLMDATLYSTSGKVTIQSGGRVRNYGEMMISNLDNQGVFENGVGAELYAHYYQAASGASAWNQAGALFNITRSFLNQGAFRNNGDCFARRDFNNLADFSQGEAGQLFINGEKSQPTLTASAQP